MNFCLCGHTDKQHSRIDDRQWCSGAPIAKKCGCTEYEFAAELATPDEVQAGIAKKAVAKAYPMGRGRWVWEPDPGDVAWSNRKDDSAKGRST
jgi:hypothetical protein